jgi:hypothetical protein
LEKFFFLDLETIEEITTARRAFEELKKKEKEEKEKKEQQLKATIPKILLHELLRLQLKLYLSYAGKEWCP